jgi:hypothetical protein
MRPTGRRALARTLAGLTAAFALAARLGAQTLPVPSLPAEPMAAEPMAAEPPRPAPWEYALGGGVGWDSNIDFLVPDGPRGLAFLPRGGVARVLASPRGRLRLTAAGGWTGYPEEHELGRYQAEGRLDGSWRSSPSTTWRADASYGAGHSDSSRILLEQGVSLPVVRMRSTAVALGVRKQGVATAFRADARYYRTAFDSEDLIDGHSLRGTVALERELGSRNTAALEYAVEDVLSDGEGRAYLTHFVSVQWTRLLSLRSALLLEAGASYTPRAAHAGLERREGFFGGASFTRQVGRAGLTLFVRREVTPAFGLGVSRLETRAGVGTTAPLGRDWELRLMASHVRPDAAPGGRPYGATDDAFVSLGRRLGRGVEVSAEARYRRRGAAQLLPEVRAFHASVFVTLLSPSGRAILPTAFR